LPDVARGIAEVFSLAAETESEIRSLGDDQPKELLLRWQPKVMATLNAMFFQRSNPPLMLDAVTASYGEDDLLSLAFCSVALHSARRDLEIERDALARVREQIVGLLDALEVDADLNRGLRSLLLRNVRAMLRACDSYDRCGTAGIRDAVNQTVGALINNPDLVARAESSPKSWQKTMAVIALVTSMVNLGTAAVTVIEKAGTGQPAQIVMVPPGRELPPGTGAVDSPPHPHGAAGPG
jgi:hypothetical protein